MKKLQIVTGGTSGMGLDTARALGEFGPVFIGGRNQKRLDDALAVLKDAGVEAYGSPCDVADIESVKAFAAAAQEIAPIGNVVNAAGVDWDVSSREQMVNINMLGVVNTTEVLYPLMTEGALLHFSSITGYFYQAEKEEMAVWSNATAPDFVEQCLKYIDNKPNPMPDRLSDDYMCYAASKRFVIFYTQANTARFGAKGLRVLSIAPGAYATPMLTDDEQERAIIAAGTAFGRVGRPDEMSYCIKALLDPRASYLTGCDIIIDGGKTALSMVPQIPA